MAKRGTPVTRIARSDEARRAAAATAQAGGAAEPDATVDERPISKLEGITDEQALRIREAVRANKRRQRGEQRMVDRAELPAEDADAPDAKSEHGDETESEQ